MTDGVNIGKRTTKKTFKADNFEDLYIDLLSECNYTPEFISSPRGIKSKEITNVTLELTDPRNRLVWNEARAVNYEFAMKFFIWMLNGDSDFAYVASSNKNAKNFIGDKKENKKKKDLPNNFSTAYGPRIVRQLPKVVDELVRDRDSRRAVIHILLEEDLEMLGTDTKEEYPCTDSFTFLIRDNKLHMYSHMRSNNIVLTICYDFFNMTLFHEYLYKLLRTKPEFENLELGTYHHSIVSAHFFEREQPLVDNVLNTRVPTMVQKKD